MKKKSLLLSVKYPGRYRVKDLDLNKLTWPVLNRAMKTACDYKKNLEEKENKELKKAKTEKEEEKIYEKYTRLHNKVFDMSLRGLDRDQIMVPATTDALLEYLSLFYLNANPKYGVKWILNDYHKYYGTGVKCAWCGRNFTPKKKGRHSAYCGGACRQKAYRDRKRHK